MKLAEFLQSRGINETQFAKQIGVSQATVNRYCRALRHPEQEVMRLIVHHTGGVVGPNDFYDFDSPPDISSPHQTPSTGAA